MTPPFDVAHELQQHGRALRGLAGELLRDANAADDATQEAWSHAVLAGPRQAQSAGGWLRTVLLHVVSRWRRGERRRAHHEAIGALRRGMVAEDHAAVLAREEVAQRLLAAVRALEPVYRDVIWARFFEDQAPRQIAAARGEPLATVKSRLQRALALLRERLGGDGDGDGGREWRAAFAAAFGLRQEVAAVSAGVGAIVFTGVLAMKKVLLAVVVVGVALCAWSWWRLEPTPPPAGGPEPARVAAAPQSAALPTSPAGEEQSRRIAAPDPLAATTAGLEVLVCWHDGTPAADIPVRVRPRPIDFEGWLRAARTGDDGIAHFAGLPPGPANALSGRGANADVDLAVGTAQRATITLEKGIDVTGRVVDLEERPIAGATVWLSVAKGSDDSEPVAVTGPDGVFTIRDGGHWFVVTATASGFGCAKEAWMESSVSTLTLTMRPTPGVLIGTVVDSDDHPVANARVLLGGAEARPKSGEHARLLGRIWGQDLWPSRFLRTDEEGRFRSEGLPAIAWPVWIGAPGFAPSWQEVAVSADAPTTVTIRLTQGATIRGRVTDERGQPIAGEDVWAYPRLPTPHSLIGAGVQMGSPSPLWAKMSATTDANGCYEINRALVAKLSIATWYRGGSARTECELRDGEVFEWNPVVEAEKVNLQQLHGVLVDEDGKPLENWTIRVDRDEEPHRGNKIWVGQGGSFRTNRVPAGSHRLFAQPRDPMIGAEVAVGEFDVANCPLRVVVPSGSVPTARVRGRIVLATGAGALGWQAMLVRDESLQSVSASCLVQGNFVLGPVQSGRYRLWAHGPMSIRFGMSTVEVVDGREVDAGTFQVPQTGTLVVRIVDAAGNRVPDAWVRAIPVGDDQRGGGLEHRDGIARGDLPAGRWRVESTEHTALARVEVDVRAGETTEARLVIPDGVPFVLRVPAGPRDRGRLSLQWREATGAIVRKSHSYADEAGKDVNLTAPAGRYTLEVVDPRDGGTATSTFDLQRSDPPPIVELPLPAKPPK